MRVYIASDHAGFEFKKTLMAFVKELGYETVDLGPFNYDPSDDYPDFIKPLARQVAGEQGAFGIIIGGSGQGEAMAANRVNGARAAVYYGPALREQTDADGTKLDVLPSTREHNDANILSIGARFLTEDEVKKAVMVWLSASFSGNERHVRRIAKLDQ